MRRILLGSAVAACVLAAGAVAVGQITNGVPSPRQRVGAPESKLAGGWDRRVLATGAQALENPVGIFTTYGYLNDAAAGAGTGCTPAYTPQTSGIRTKTEPDQNTYIVTTSNPGGPSSTYDYGRHFLVQGHELFSNTGSGVGQVDSAYITRINLDVPVFDKHRITLLGTVAGADNCSTGMASLDGSTLDPFTGQLLITAEAGGNATYGGVYASSFGWSSTTAPPVTRLSGSFGYAGYEGVQVDNAGRVYLAEDSGGSTVSNGVKKANSFVFRFVPDNANDLTAGKLQALQVSIDGTPLTFASQDPVAGTPDKRLYAGEQLTATWVTVHDTTGGNTANFDANAAAKAANATPFKRPENLRFFPGTGFKSLAFTVTGDTSSVAIQNQTPDGAAQADRGAAGAVMRVDMASSGATAATVKAIVPGDLEHTAYDSITFLDKDTLLVGEDRGDTLHGQLNALDSTWSFDLTKPIDQQFANAQRLIAQGRDDDSLEDVHRREGNTDNPGAGTVADQNDGDNEITGLLVSDGISTTGSVFGTNDPGTESGTRIFYTDQHGSNRTFELIPPGAGSSNTWVGDKGAKGDKGDKGDRGDKGDAGPAGKDGLTGHDGPAGFPGSTGPRGKTLYCRMIGRKTVACSFVRPTKKGFRARLVRHGRTYAYGMADGPLHAIRTLPSGYYTMVLTRGHATKRVGTWLFR